jgi:hypothetical protein
MIPLCSSPYVEWALTLHLVIYPAYFPSPDDRFTGLCYRDHVICESAKLAINRAFSVALQPTTAECVPQPATTIKRKLWKKNSGLSETAPRSQ